MFILGTYVEHVSKKFNGIVTKACGRKFGINGSKCNYFPIHFRIVPLHDKKNVEQKSIDTIEIDISEIDGAASRLFDYLKYMKIPTTDNFLSFTTDRVSTMLTFNFQWSANHSSYKYEPFCLECNEINCDEVYPPRTNCKTKDGIFPMAEQHQKTKLFVDGFSNFLDYVYKIQSKRTTMYFHSHLWRYIFKTLISHKDWVVVSHNQDVNTLHFKFENIPILAHKDVEVKANDGDISLSYISSKFPKSENLILDYLEPCLGSTNNGKNCWPTQVYPGRDSGSFRTKHADFVGSAKKLRKKWSNHETKVILIVDDDVINPTRVGPIIFTESNTAVLDSYGNPVPPFSMYMNVLTGTQSTILRKVKILGDRGGYGAYLQGCIKLYNTKDKTEITINNIQVTQGSLEKELSISKNFLNSKEPSNDWVRRRLEQTETQWENQPTV